MIGHEKIYYFLHCKMPLLADCVEKVSSCDA